MGIQIRYAGHILPQDKAQPFIPPVDPNVNYGGNILPAAGKQYVAIPMDPSNQPNLVMLGTVQSNVVQNYGTAYSPPVTGAVLQNGVVVLPADVVIKGYVEKVIAETTILDGVDVNEHIRRSPIYFELEFVARAKSGPEWIFAQAFINNLFQKIILPASVIYISNTFLNGLGITEMVIRKGEFDTIRANINVPIIMRCKESMPGTSLIVPLTNP
jgi:hypothetical protein